MCNEPKFPSYSKSTQISDIDFKEIETGILKFKKKKKKEEDFEQKSLLILKWQKYKRLLKVKSPEISASIYIAQYLLSVFEIITGFNIHVPYSCDL